MEDLPIKAIFIGVSIFVTMAVFSAIILYFNTAREVAYVVAERVDIADSYDSIMREDNFEATLTGVEVRSLITKYVGNTDIEINILEINGQEPTKYKEKDINDRKINYNNINNNSSWVQNGILKESILDIINPIWNCKVEKVEKGEMITLNISLDVDNKNNKEGEI